MTPSMCPTPISRLPNSRRSLGQLFRAIHDDDRGVVTLETILILGAVAIPVLIVLLKFGWPKIREYFMNGMERLEQEGDRAIQGS